MLTRDDIKKGDVLRCISLTTSDRILREFTPLSGLIIGNTYTVKVVPDRGPDRHWIDVEGNKSGRWLPLDIFELVVKVDKGYVPNPYYPLHKGNFPVEPAPPKAGDTYRAIRSVPNPYGGGVNPGEIVTITHVHARYSSQVMLAGKGQFYFTISDRENFEPLTDSNALLRELLAVCQQIPDPKKEPLQASMKLSDLIDLIESKLS